MKKMSWMEKNRGEYEEQAERFMIPIESTKTAKTRPKHSIRHLSVKSKITLCSDFGSVGLESLSACCSGQHIHGEKQACFSTKKRQKNQQF